jgi:hypothetical protein
MEENREKVLQIFRYFFSGQLLDIACCIRTGCEGAGSEFSSSIAIGVELRSKGAYHQTEAAQINRTACFG